MRRRNLLIFLSLFLLASCDGTKYSSDGYQMKQLDSEKVTVSFYYNFNKQEINLNSGMFATGNSLAFKVDEILKGEKASEPDTNPVRKNFEFNGWHKNPNEKSLFNFESEIINSNTVLYAHWLKVQEEEFVEPEYVVPSKVDDSLSTLVKIDGVLNDKVINNQVELSISSINRLIKDKNDVKGCLNYKIKSGVSFEASYNTETNKISYHASKDENSLDGTITVIDNSFNLVVDNTTYEGKAKKYEEKASDIEDYRIMLAGSSSMENWSTSTEDLLPLKTYNHGIGGTTINQWRNCLNERLVYPFSPKMVVYYVGVNNLINSKDSPEDTASELIRMFDDVHEHLPNTHIYYVLINDLPGYLSYKNSINYVNNAAIEYEATHSYLTNLDAGKLLLKKNGLPNSAYFMSDGLHMSKCGYVLWGGFIKNKLIEDLKNK